MNSDGEVLREFDPRPASPASTSGSRSTSTSSGSPRKSCRRASSARGPCTTRARIGGLEANAGAVVVLDADTGGIVAMASWPTFRPAWFVRGLTEAQRFQLFESERAPMLNRATRITYAPGSTFKPFVALAAVKEGFASLGGYYDCPAEYVHPGDESGALFHNWDGTGAGVLSIADGLRLSCDTQYYAWGSQFYNRDLGTGQEELQRHVRRWGFGRPSGVDLPAEAAGTVPDRRYVGVTRTCTRTANPGIDILLAIGSGEMKATPLQVAQAYAAIASGKLCRPHLVARIQDGRATP